mmetsp:Transcript_195/g.250  ORF Transcript_195/g.250 Transcript_195/m.250 type:complete len:253 (-) Transcript_195:293-1051(-)|eukprot:CAMPEP_0170800606 /NCGR_PEP_ID=MMETSP0733-20121128/27938_1 /TAXON_ID=186038 /ORGANISM="Fragilariopsis kerguelensis, Strain L26-C5" /LENGTH=252 /DNA_ID=CAMNT_0011152955 /DNA_START=63 /DNA_END=821 /DNA_ORIENTATION=-
MTDNKLRCALIYRLESDSSAVCVAKFDYAGQYETHGGAESSLYGGRDKSYAEAVGGVLSNDPPSGLSQPGTFGGFKVVQSDQHQIVYGADVDGLCCATITGTQYPSRVAITMLQDLYTNFSAKYGDAAKTAAENSLSKKAKTILQDSCKKFADPSSVDKTQQVLGQVDAVKGQMQDNIASMLQNTEKAEDMAAKSEQLNEQASVFKKRSTDLKKKMQWKNLKMTIILGSVIVVIILAITVPLIMKAKRLAGI